MDLRDPITNAGHEVARENNLTAGHGARTFVRMTRDVFDRIQPKIDTALDTKVAERLDAEKARIAQILEAPEAKGREDTARRLALDSDMTAEKAIKFLESMPKSVSNRPTPLDVAMQNETGTVSADDGCADQYGQLSPDHQTEMAADQILNAGIDR